MRATEGNKDSRFPAVVTACTIYGERVGDRGKAGLHLPPCDLPAAETGLGFQASLAALSARGAPEASFLLEVGKSALVPRRSAYLTMNKSP